MKNDERAISNLIATLILIAVAVVGGAFAYSVFRDQAQSTTTSAGLQVQSLNAVDVGGTVHLSTTVKNTGSQQLTNVTVDIDPNDGSNVLDVGALDPGQTGSASTDDTGLVSGKTYAVEITANTAGGGSITRTRTVRVES